MTPEPFCFEVVGCGVRVLCDHAEEHELLRISFGHLPYPTGKVHLNYRIYRIEGDLLQIERDGVLCEPQSGREELLPMFDDDLVIALQEKRSELFFLHSAVLEINGRAVLFPADSGSGKSTLAWVFTQHGFRYLSDELAPIDLDSLEVHPFPRALTLKAAPPEPYPLPESAIRSGRFIHVPCDILPGKIQISPLPVAAVFFPDYEPAGDTAELRLISKGRAAARIYAASLNALAHPASGLKAAASIATSVPCYELATSDLAAASGTVKRILSSLAEFAENRSASSAEGDASNGRPVDAV